MQQAREHTLKAFDEDLDRLRALIAQLGGLAEHAIGEAMRCLVQRDLYGAMAVVRDDVKLDKLETVREHLNAPGAALYFFDRRSFSSRLRELEAERDDIHLVLADQLG